MKMCERGRMNECMSESPVPGMVRRKDVDQLHVKLEPTWSSSLTVQWWRYNEYCTHIQYSMHASKPIIQNAIYY